ncbi:MAG: SIS domain-containing protein [Deltaproteobacteria bacterium]|nr:SIS domain-containing protein [Deltaproteobacteria bacterium]
MKKTAATLNDNFAQAIELIYSCTGRLCITGMGKAGLVGQKIQATFASVGTLSYCLHPAEALHGDLGMVDKKDVVIALSKSDSLEIAIILPMLKKLGCRIILITAKANSPATQGSDCVLLLGSTEEACPLGLASSSSTTAMLALGDALALTVMKQETSLRKIMR